MHIQDYDHVLDKLQEHGLTLGERLDAVPASVVKGLCAMSATTSPTKRSSKEKQIDAVQREESIPQSLRDSLMPFQWEVNNMRFTCSVCVGVWRLCACVSACILFIRMWSSVCR